MFASKSFGLVTVQFFVEGYYNEATFSIDNVCRMESEVVAKHKVAITRWLLGQFKAAQKEYEYLTCKPYANDGYGEYREGVFKKLGFVNNEKAGMLWVKPAEEIQPIKEVFERGTNTPSQDILDSVKFQEFRSKLTSRLSILLSKGVSFSQATDALYAQLPSAYEMYKPYFDWVWAEEATSFIFA